MYAFHGKPRKKNKRNEMKWEFGFHFICFCCTSFERALRSGSALIKFSGAAWAPAQRIIKKSQMASENEIKHKLRAAAGDKALIYIYSLIKNRSVRRESTYLLHEWHHIGWQHFDGCYSTLSLWGCFLWYFFWVRFLFVFKVQLITHTPGWTCCVYARSVARKPL